MDDGRLAGAAAGAVRASPPRSPGSRRSDTADREIERTLDVAHEHALKVFETIDRSLSEINEIIRGIPDADIRSREPALHRAAEATGRLAAAGQIGLGLRRARAMRWSTAWCRRRPRSIFPTATTSRPMSTSDIGTFIGDALTPRPPYQGAAFFGVSRRRQTDDGSFTGVIQASVLPEYFENFYARIGRDPGSFFALGLRRRHGAGPLSRCSTAISGSIRNGPVGQKIAASPKARPHHHDLARRRHRAPARLSKARRLSGLCQRRARDLGDPRALARHHGPASGFRPARHRAAVSDSGAGAAAHPAPPRRGRRARWRPRRR